MRWSVGGVVGACGVCGHTCCCGRVPQDIKNEKKKIKRTVDKTKDVPSAELWKELARREAVAQARHGAVPSRRHVVPRRGWRRVCGCSVVAIGGSSVCAPPSPLCGGGSWFLLLSVLPASVPPVAVEAKAKAKAKAKPKPKAKAKAKAKAGSPHRHAVDLCAIARSLCLRWRRSWCVRPR